MTDKTVSSTTDGISGSRWTYMDVVNSPVLESLAMGAADKPLSDSDKHAAHLLLDLLIARHNRETA